MTTAPMTTAAYEPPPTRTDSSLVWFARECLSNDVRLEALVRSAERGGDAQLADFFRRAHAESRRVQAA